MASKREDLLLAAKKLLWEWAMREHASATFRKS
jgi:hypothetical protein